MSCPHLKEVVMLYCDAFPVKKMIPLDRLVSAEPCLGQGFARCPMYAQCHPPATQPQPVENLHRRKEATR
ncbi:MAG: hypothetical protein AB7O37_08145 [Vicinamibacteria bacterium]